MIVDPDTCNENILIRRIMNSEEQHDQLCGLTEELVSGEYRLLIVDSIMNLFRTDYSGRGELSERQQKLGQHLRKLVETAEEFNMVVFMTNQVQSDPGASALFASADGRKPVGGHILAHASTTRVLLRKGRGDERVAKIMDSPGQHPPSILTCKPSTNPPYQTAQRAKQPTLLLPAASMTLTRPNDRMFANI